jgi:hypothetical protein
MPPICDVGDNLFQHSTATAQRALEVHVAHHAPAVALGLGAILTTLYLSFEKKAEAALGLPAGVHSYALLPIGY